MALIVFGYSYKFKIQNSRKGSDMRIKILNLQYKNDASAYFG